MNDLKLIILGPPTSGKGTRAKIIAEEFGLQHISTGDMFREIVKETSELGLKVKALIDAGELVSDEITNEIVKNRLRNTEGGFILDGYPRNIDQALALDAMTQIDHAFYVAVPDEEVERRVIHRRVCPQCNGIYHLLESPSRVDGVCDNCGAPLIHRLDDTPEVIKNRLQIYYQQTHPITDIYRQRGILLEVSGEGEKSVSIANLLEKIRELLA